MHQSSLYIVLILFFSSAKAFAGPVKFILVNGSLSGRVTGKSKGTALPGDSVYIPDLDYNSLL